MEQHVFNEKAIIWQRIKARQLNICYVVDIKRGPKWRDPALF